MVYDIDRAVEAWTDRLHDQYYSTAPQWQECEHCGDEFLDEEVYGTKYDEKLMFCSESCAESWEEENAWEYEDD